MTAKPPFFSSDRERRLWLWTLVVVAMLFLTIGFARTLAEWVEDRGLLGAIPFLLGCLLVLATVVTSGLRVRPSGLELGVGLGVGAAYLMVFVRMASPVERSHLVEYGVVAIFIHEALKERALQGRRVPAPAMLAVVAAGLVGMVDECLQRLAPDRVYDPIDMVFNVLAAGMAVGTSKVLAWARLQKRGGG